MAAIGVQQHPADWLREAALARPRHAALVFEKRTWSYAQLDAATDALVTAMTSMGVQRGQHVAMFLPSEPLAVAMIHACARAGLVLVPLSTRLTPDEALWQLQRVRCVLLVAGSEERMSWQAGDAGISVLAADTLRHLVEATQGNEDHPMPSQPLDLDQVQAIVFTSGTTGQPKGAQLTFGNHFASAMASALRLGLQLNDRWLCVLPLYHVGGQAVILRSALYATTVVLQPRFEVEAVSMALDDESTTLVSLVPTMLARLLDVRTHWPTRLRAVLLGGAAASHDLLERAFTAGVPVAPTYGLTEATSQVATATPAETRRKLGSVGRPMAWTRLQVVDAHGTSLPPGEPGEVCVQGPTVMRGYLDDPNATAHTIRDGWLHTGDIGYLDGDGDLWLLERRSDLIITGGENVYPAEVEAVLRTHSAVADVAVVGLPDEEWGQRVAAVIVLQKGAEPAQDLMEAFVRTRLAGYKVPRRWAFVDTLPTTSTGKTLRADLPALFDTRSNVSL